MRRYLNFLLMLAWRSGWTIGAPVVRPLCPVCRGNTRPRLGYRRLFLQCGRCEFLFCHDTPEFMALEGMGMFGSWGGPQRGGEREDFLTRMLSREFGAQTFLLFGVGSALAFSVLLDEGFDVYGADVSEDVVNYRTAQAGSRFFRAQDLRAVSSAYDAVIACEVLEHLHSPHRWLGHLLRSLRPGGILCGTTNFYPGGPIEDGQKIGYMSMLGHVAYWSGSSLSEALREYGMQLVFFEMISPGSVKPDRTFGDLFPNKRVFFASSDVRKIEILRNQQAREPILPLDMSDYPHPAYRRAV